MAIIFSLISLTTSNPKCLRKLTYKEASKWGSSEKLEQRPHYSNYMLTPEQMHLQNQIRMRTYKTKNSSKHLLTTV